MTNAPRGLIEKTIVVRKHTRCRPSPWAGAVASGHIIVHMRNHRRNVGAGAVNLEHRLLDEILGPRMIAGLTEEVPEESRGESVVENAERRFVPVGIPVHRDVEVVRLGHEATCNTSIVRNEARSGFGTRVRFR